MVNIFNRNFSTKKYLVGLMTILALQINLIYMAEILILSTKLQECLNYMYRKLVNYLNI